MKKKLLLIIGLTLTFGLNCGRTELKKGHKPRMHIPDYIRAQRNALAHEQAHKRAVDSDPCGKCLTTCAKTSIALLAVAATTAIPTAIYLWVKNNS
jgi:hypothetical protein